MKLLLSGMICKGNPMTRCFFVDESGDAELESQRSGAITH
jgi:hypothetical protein